MKTVALIRSTGIYNDSRATKEIYALIEAGYKVLVLGWDRDGVSGARSKEVFCSVSSSVDFFFYEQPLSNGIGMKNIYKLCGWFCWVYKTLKRETNIYAVHACDLDSGVPAYRFCKKKKKKLIYDIYDYYADSRAVPSVLRAIIESVETRIINLAHATVICTEERRAQIGKARPKNLLVIHNSPEISGVPNVEEMYDYVYCGSLAEKRLIREIFEGYEENFDLSFAFAGYGEYGEMAKALQSRNEHFAFLEAIPYSKVLELEAQTKVLAAIYEPTIRNHRLCAPNKFYEALALGKPVIVCKGTGIDKIVESNNIGICIDYDAEQFYAALRSLIASPDERREMGIRARRLYDEKYSWKKMKNILVEFYSKL